DVTIQAQVLDLMHRLREQNQTSMIMITHDLGIIAESCDDVAVMYAGSIVEQGTLREVFNDTKHPYTQGLFDSLPDIENRKAELKPIPGLMPDPTNLPEGCAFAPRCPYASEECMHVKPKKYQFSETHVVACSAYDKADFKLHREEDTRE
ncbi:MAG: ABC transporter ATP-binding protein, partial [Lachnospiraceae bacterium]|nr:ABC transporter ATP-binding protein [Lachnospiraceae bacterium]